MNDRLLPLVVAALNDYWDVPLMDRFGNNGLTVKILKGLDKDNLDWLIQLAWKSPEMPDPDGYKRSLKEERPFNKICANELGSLLKAKSDQFIPIVNSRRSIDRHCR